MDEVLTRSLVVIGHDRVASARTLLSREDLPLEDVDQFSTIFALVGLGVSRSHGRISLLLFQPGNEAIHRIQKRVLCENTWPYEVDIYLPYTSE